MQDGRPAITISTVSDRQLREKGRPHYVKPSEEMSVTLRIFLTDTSEYDRISEGMNKGEEMRYLLVAVLVVAGCAARHPRVGRAFPYRPRYAELAAKLAEIPEIIKADEFRSTGHRWRKLAYMEWKKEKQYYAFEMARRSFRESANWYHLAKEKHPEYADYVDAELKAVYRLIAMCIMEQPELLKLPHAMVEEQHELEMMIQKRLEVLSETVQRWERMRGR